MGVYVYIREVTHSEFLLAIEIFLRSMCRPVILTLFFVLLFRSCPRRTESDCADATIYNVLHFTVFSYRIIRKPQWPGFTAPVARYVRTRGEKGV